MAKILLLSDSHGHVTAIENAIRTQKPDVVVFLGDCVPDMVEAQQEFPALDVRCVCGNCDTEFAAPEQLIMNIGGVEVLACHGNSYGVNTSLLRLYMAAKEMKCTAAFFGHTHRKHIEEKDGVMLINPGALCDGSMAVLETRNGKLEVIY